MNCRVSVVVPTLNRSKDIRECIAALEAQTLPRDEFEVIVVDGGSRDDTISVLEEREAAGRIRLRHFTERRKGAGVARNLGVRESHAAHIAFTDDDCIPEPGWLAALLGGFPKDEKCAAVGGPIIPADSGNVINRYCMHCRNWKGMSFGGRTMHIPTMNVLYRRQALLEVGVFDENVIIGEDILLSQKITKQGYSLRNIDAGAVVHKDPATLGALYRKAWAHGTGIAEAGQVHGRKLKGGGLSLLSGLLVRKGYAERIGGAGNIRPGDRMAFELLHRLWMVGVYRGYAHRMKDYISRR
jgi:glycosyltransferase involved in cell wall biosynthesis